jgi:hypothetical protein
VDSKTGGVNPPAHGPRQAVVGLLAAGPANGALMSIAPSVAAISIQSKTLIERSPTSWSLKAFRERGKLHGCYRTTNVFRYRAKNHQVRQKEAARSRALLH